ncbi:hypothetical protein AAHA92_05547 [Salvia divinorum]|uniref:Uncharacterized protein n=1 Tax=Salvia divinorum TaxID=28513 RepID=A0ABD1I2S7_SALDI
MGNCIGVSDKKLCRRKLSLWSSRKDEIEILIQKRGSNLIRIRKRVKMVVSKKQLQRLMASVEEVQLRRMVLQSLLRRSRKWRPSLAAIPEV